MLFFLFASACHAQDYESRDSMLVEQMLAGATDSGSDAEDRMVYFGKLFEGTPYKAKTLDQNTSENLTINLRQLDCTTFVENVLALSLCIKNGRKSFRDFTDYLRQVRYEGGIVAYDHRLHYFSSWIDSNTQRGFAQEVSYDDDDYQLTPDGICSRRAEVNFMTSHPHLYPALKGDSVMVRRIGEIEKSLSDKSYEYIPKTLVSDTRLMKRYVKSGDIIAIVTSKAGLDVSHVGIALWHSDGTLHLLNASQIHKKVIDEQLTLYQYMQKHPSQLGIRVVRVL